MAMNAIAISCDCGHEYKVKPEAVGRSVKCPHCTKRNLVVAPQEKYSQKAEFDPVRQESTNNGWTVGDSIRVVAWILVSLALGLFFLMTLVSLADSSLAFIQPGYSGVFDDRYAPGMTANEIQQVRLELSTIRSIIVLWVTGSLIAKCFNKLLIATGASSHQK